DEVHQRDHHLDGQDDDQEHRQNAVRLAPAESEEERGVDQVADAVQAQLVLLRGAPGETHGELDGGEGGERDGQHLHRHQRPEDESGHVAASRKTATWRMSAPKRGWTRSRVKLNQPSPSSPCVTVSAPGASQRSSAKRRPSSSTKYPALRKTSAASTTCTVSAMPTPKPTCSSRPVGPAKRLAEWMICGKPARRA